VTTTDRKQEALRNLRRPVVAPTPARAGRGWAHTARVWGLAIVVTAVAVFARPSQRPEPPQWPFIASPNVDVRPPGAHITCVVMHATEIERLRDTVGCFLSPQTKVSAHFVVGRDGAVVQMVSADRRAWHAGRSAHRGVRNVNDFSIGIEMVNRGDGVDPYPPAQVEACAEIVRALRRRHAIPDSHIVTHAAVARPAGRKEDPLGFDMVAFRRLCRRSGR
jgi:N-acetyl-anhydromuramyl-L-alanine amidase AmpD